MELTRQHPGDKVFVRAMDASGIRVADQTYAPPLILTPESIIENWGVSEFERITRESLEPVLDLEPEVVIIGCGGRQRFLEPEISALFLARGMGIEVMTSQAACRTFNVLAMEERRVVAALLPL